MSSINFAPISSSRPPSRWDILQHCRAECTPCGLAVHNVLLLRTVASSVPLWSSSMCHCPAASPAVRVVVSVGVCGACTAHVPVCLAFPSLLHGWLLLPPASSSVTFKTPLLLGLCCACPHLPTPAARPCHDLDLLMVVNGEPRSQHRGGLGPSVMAASSSA
jgi:hypothetical protein